MSPGTFVATIVLVIALWFFFAVGNTSRASPPLSDPVLSACAEAYRAQYSSQWPMMSRLQRAAIGSQAILACE